MSLYGKFYELRPLKELLPSPQASVQNCTLLILID